MEQTGQLPKKQKSAMKQKRKDKKSFKGKSSGMEKKNEDKKFSKPFSKHKEQKKTLNDPTQFSENWKKLLSENKELKEERKKAKKRKQHNLKEPVPAEKKSKESEKPEIWFDDVDEFLIEGSREDNTEDTGQVVPASRSDDNNPLVKSKSFTGVTRAIALDCEMVGVGLKGEESILARVSIVNQFGQCIYDTFVQATEKVTDYRTEVSGVRPKDMASGEEFSVVQKKVAELMKDRLLVGHAIENDLKVLLLDHPRRMIRDTQRYRPFKVACGGGKPALRKLTAKLLKVPIQTGEHSSIQDAQASMRLYTMYRKQWEKDIRDQKPVSAVKLGKKRKQDKEMRNTEKKRRKEELKKKVELRNQSRNVLNRMGGHFLLKS